MRWTHGRITGLTLLAVALGGAAALLGPSCGRGGGGGGGSPEAGEAPGPTPAPGPAPSPSAATPVTVIGEATASGVKGRFDASVAGPQTLAGLPGTALAGVAITIPAGALADSVEVELATTSGVASGPIPPAYGLTRDAVSSGLALQIEVRPPIAARAAFTVVLPAPPALSLTEAAGTTLVVLHDAAAPSAGASVLTPAAGSTADAVVASSTTFGRFQAVLLAGVEPATTTARRRVARGPTVLSPRRTGAGPRLEAHAPLLSPARTAGTPTLDHEGAGP